MTFVADALLATMPKNTAESIRRHGRRRHGGYMLDESTSMAITAGIPPRPRGLGDFVEFALAKLGGRRLKTLWFWWTGKDCGCARRQAALNRWFPFRKL